MSRLGFVVGGTMVLALASGAQAQVASNASAGSAAPAAVGAGQASATADAPGLGELVTDRPDFTESSEVVGQQVAQLETGLAFESDGSGIGRRRSITFPSALLRVGLTPKMELRIGAEGLVSESVFGSARSSGAADMELAMKYKFLEQEKAGLNMAIILLASLPTGSAALSSGRPDPGMKLCWARDLPAGFGLSGNFNYASLTDEAGRFTQGSISASLGHDLVAGWGGYWEVFSFSPMERAATTAWIFDTGISHLLGPNQQVDFTVGRGLTSAAPDWFVSAGFSLRGRMR